MALVVAWAAVFGVAYTLGSNARSRSSAPPSAQSLATGSGVPASASLTINGLRRSARRVAITALPSLPAPPTLKPIISHVVARARTYYVPVYRPAATAGSPASQSSPTGGGPHGSGGTGGGTTTVGGNSGGGGLGSGTTTTPTTTTPTPTTSTPGTTLSGG